MIMSITTTLQESLTMDLAVWLTLATVVAGTLFTLFIVLLALGPYLPTSLGAKFSGPSATRTLTPDTQDSD